MRNCAASSTVAVEVGVDSRTIIQVIWRISSKGWKIYTSVSRGQALLSYNDGLKNKNWRLPVLVVSMTVECTGGCRRVRLALVIIQSPAYQRPNETARPVTKRIVVKIHPLGRLCVQLLALKDFIPKVTGENFT